MKLRKNPKINQCRIQRCYEAPYARGVCRVHADILKKKGTYEEWAAPKKYTGTFARKKRIYGNTCIIEGCMRPRLCRGICSSHSSYLRKKGLFEGLAFTKAPKVYKIRKNPRPGKCCISGCLRKEMSRGLCDSHHGRFSKTGRMEQFAAPSKYSYYHRNTYQIKKRITPGICRMIENDNRCGNNVYRHGLCTKHYSIFNLHGALEKWKA